VIIYSDGSTNILRASCLRYFADYAPLGPNAAAIVTALGETMLIVEPRWDAARARRHSWIDEVVGTDSFAPSVCQARAGLGVAERAGLAAGREMPFPIYDVLVRALPLDPADDLIDSIAREKSPAEIERVRRAAAAADAGFEAFRSAASVGVRE